MKNNVMRSPHWRTRRLSIFYNEARFSRAQDVSEKRVACLHGAEANTQPVADSLPTL
jgi:hypothetical protein